MPGGVGVGRRGRGWRRDWRRRRRWRWRGGYACQQGFEFGWRGALVASNNVIGFACVRTIKRALARGLSAVPVPFEVGVGAIS